MSGAGAVDRERLHRLLRRLLDTYSPSGKEPEALRVAGRALKAAGLPMERLPVAGDRYDLLVRSPGTEPAVVLLGHLDTVPAYDLEDFAYSQDGDVVSGLGAADMKGGCAALVEAFVAWQEAHPGEPLPAALALVVGEEEAGDGTAALLEETSFDWALVGEPTSLAPCLGCWSYVELQLAANGRRAHAALGNAEDNAIQALLHRLFALLALLESHPAGPVFNLRDLDSASRGFAIPDWCEAWLDVHLPPGVDLGAFVSEVEAHVVGGLDRATRERITLGFETIDAGFQLADQGLLPERLHGVFAARRRPYAPEAFRSHSDANQLFHAGVRPVVLGPGSLAVAHTAEEQVSFAEVTEAAAIYLALLEALARPD